MERRGEPVPVVVAVSRLYGMYGCMSVTVVYFLICFDLL